MSQNEFPDLEPLGTEVDYHCISLACSAEITKRLGDMLRGDCLDSLQFHYEAVLDEQVSEIVPKDSAVFVPYL